MTSEVALPAVLTREVPLIWSCLVMAIALRSRVTESQENKALQVCNKSKSSWRSVEGRVLEYLTSVSRRPSSVINESS